MPRADEPGDDATTAGSTTAADQLVELGRRLGFHETWSERGDLRVLAETLGPGEQLAYVVRDTDDGSTFLVTDQRLLRAYDNGRETSIIAIAIERFVCVHTGDAPHGDHSVSFCTSESQPFEHDRVGVQIDDEPALVDAVQTVRRQRGLPDLPVLYRQVPGRRRR